MADKKITDLQLRLEVTDEVNFPIDDGIQSYRVTGAQIESYVLASQKVQTSALANQAVTTSKIADSNVTLNKLALEVLSLMIPVGAMLPFAPATLPAGTRFLLVQGQAISRVTYADLFAAIGTTYGSGDGSTTFNLPNFNGIGWRGIGSQTYGGVTYNATLGQKRNDAIQNITGAIAATTYQRLSGTKTGAFGNISGATAQDENGTFHGAFQSGIDFDASRVARTDTQTHGADLATNMIIRF